MNYIKNLEQQVAELKLEIKRKDKAMSDLFTYLSLPKFWEDTTVQVYDVKQRLLNIRMINGWEGE